MITIITPCYNRAETIERTILSVLQQKKDTEIEYIVVDGASTDGSVQIINKYRDKIDVVISEPDRGIADAYNKGIRLAHGDLIGIVAADDRLVPGVLKKVVQEYDGHSDVFVGNNIVDSNTGRFRLAKSSRNLEELRYRMEICHPSMLVTKKAYEQYGLYSLEYKCAMDRELTLRFYLNGATFQFSDLYINVFTASGGISTTEASIPDGEDDIISEKYGMSHDEVEQYRLMRNAKRNSFKKRLRFALSKMIPDSIKMLRARYNPNQIFEEDIQKMYIE